jgi:hypothetical protein
VPSQGSEELPAYPESEGKKRRYSVVFHLVSYINCFRKWAVTRRLKLSSKISIE